MTFVISEWFTSSFWLWHGWMFPPWLSMFSFRVLCRCGFCEPKKQALSEWERHTGSKFRNWKTSIQVKGPMLPLEQWVSIWQYFWCIKLPISLPLKCTTYLLLDYSSSIWLTVSKCPIICFCFYQLVLWMIFFPSHHLGVISNYYQYSSTMIFIWNMRLI